MWKREQVERKMIEKGYKRYIKKIDKKKNRNRI